jgi:MFS family permease
LTSYFATATILRMLTNPVAFVYGALCILSYAAFALFYVSEDARSPRSIVKASIAFVIASLVTFYIGVAVGGALAVAATFYVVDRKNRSRGWALVALLFGPITLLITVCLPKVAGTTLSLTGPPAGSANAARKP